MATITRPAALVRQGLLKLYATSVTVRDFKLPGFYQINKLDPDGDGPGFQRLLSQSRANRLAEYLLEGHQEGDAFLPTSIFLATSKNIAFDSATNSITFDVSEVGPFNVVDGQHRIAGLVTAADKNPELLNFEMPVNIAVNLDDVSQMSHFLIVNTTQRSVEKGVEQQIIARLSAMVDLENMPTIPRWIRRQVLKGDDARALFIAQFLNTEAGSTWQGKIRMANDETPDAAINQHSFVNSLKKYIFAASNPLADTTYDTNRHKILSNYWKAVAELLIDPEAEVSSVIFKTTGVNVFHVASATVFFHLVNAGGDFRKDAIVAVLKRGLSNLGSDFVQMSSPEWWQRGGGASGLNNAAVHKLANALSHALNVQTNTGSVLL